MDRALRGAEDSLLRSSFGQSRLVRLLGEGTPLPADGAGMDVAERMSLWLGAFAAIRLQGTHRALRGDTAPAQLGADAARLRTQRLADNLQRVRAALTAAIARDLDPGEGTYAPYRQRHLDLQRHMEQMIATLREQVREGMSALSPRLRQLAALDAALEEVIAAREQALLPTAADLLERRFEQLRGDDGAVDTAAFLPSWRKALLAELELRLEPVAGLVEACRKESNLRAS